jgi:hypothetical protein
MMWKYSFLAEERIQSALREAERNRVANMVRNASKPVPSELPHTLLNRVTLYVSDVADRVVQVVRSWDPAAGSPA